VKQLQLIIAALAPQVLLIEEDEGWAKMWVLDFLVSQKICTPKTFTRFGSISISRCQDFVTFFSEKTGPSYLSKYAESVISLKLLRSFYPPRRVF
jgi:hypothetical protein